MQMEIVLTDGDRVDARYRDLAIRTAQDGSAPAPFELFLASIGTCAGIYVSRFCRQRGIPPSGVRIVQRAFPDPASRMVARIELDIELPEAFPERYRDAVVRAAELCAVKKHLARPPEIEVRTVSGRPA